MDAAFQSSTRFVGRVFAVNIVLALLALSTIVFERSAHLGALAAGCAIVAGLLWSFARGQR